MKNYSELNQYLKTLTAEMCLKLGTTLTGLVLNVPEETLLRMLPASAGGLPGALREYPGLYGNGDTSFTDNGGIVAVQLNGEAVASAYREYGSNPFLAGLVRLTLAHVPMAELLDFFRTQGEVRVVPVQDDEFDILAYYPTGEPDAFLYCLKDEGIGVDVHRYTKGDFEAFGYEI